MAALYSLYRAKYVVGKAADRIIRTERCAGARLPNRVAQRIDMCGQQIRTRNPHAAIGWREGKWPTESWNALRFSARLPRYARYATARTLFSANANRSSRSAFEVIAFQSNQSMTRFWMERSSHTNQAKQVLLGARRPCQP
jgi:hypothetical protein